MRGIGILIGSKKGFTVVELLAGMLSMAILILIVGLLLVHGWNGWRYSKTAVTQQRDATLAQKVIAKEIRNAGYGGMDFSGTGQIRFTNGVSVYLAGNALIRSEGSESFILMNDGVVDFDAQPVISNQSIHVVIKYLSDGNDLFEHKEFTVFPRNES